MLKTVDQVLVWLTAAAQPRAVTEFARCLLTARIRSSAAAAVSRHLPTSGLFVNVNQARKLMISFKYPELIAALSDVTQRMHNLISGHRQRRAGRTRRAHSTAASSLTTWFGLADNSISARLLTGLC